MHLRILPWPIAACIALIITCGSQSAIAQNQSILIPAESNVVIQLDLPAFQATSVGAKAFNLAIEGLRDAMSGDPESANADQMIAMLGFDPAVEMQRISVVLNNLENPVGGLGVIVELRQTAGNLAGVLMMMDNYQAVAHRNYRVHSFTLDADPINLVVHTDASGTVRLIAASTVAAVSNMLDHLDGATSGELSRRVAQSNGNIADVDIYQFPSELVTEAPFSGIASVIRALNVQLTNDDVSLLVSVAAKTASEQDAQQLAQMVQALTSMMVSMGASDPNAPAEVKMLAQLLQSLTVNVQSNSAVFMIQVPQSVIKEQVSAMLPEA